MASLNISLPQPLKKYVESQVSLGEYGPPSEFVRELIRRDKATHVAKLEEGLLKALGTGSTSRITAKELATRPLLELLEEKLSERPRKR